MPLNDELFEGAEVRFRNFRGAPGPFNSEGDRNFCIFLDPERALELEAKGFNVKTLRAREDGDDDRKYVQVAVNYGKGRPPRIMLINSRGRIDLGADEVELLDYADILNWDIVINPYEWTVNDNKGVKAYLKHAFITINENELERKYADVPDLNPTKSSSTVSEKEEAVA